MGPTRFFVLLKIGFMLGVGPTRKAIFLLNSA